MRRLAIALLLLVGSPALGQTVRDLVELTDLSAVSISPDGRYAAFRTERASIEKNDFALEWRLVALDGRTPARVIAGAGTPIWRDAGVIVSEPPVWSPDSRAIYYRALIDGEVQVWRTSIDGQTQRLTSDSADVERFALSGDGTSLIYTVGPSRDAIRRAEEDEYDSGIRIDATIDPAQNLFRSARVNGRLASQRLTGQWFARAGLLWATPRRTKTLNLATLEIHETSSPPNDGVTRAPPADDGITATAVADDGRAVHVLTDRNGTQTLVLAKSAACTNADACRVATAVGENVAELAWRPHSDEVIFTIADRRLAYALKAWNTRTGEVRTITREDGLISGGRDADSHCAVGAAFAVCVIASPVTPPRLVRIDLDSSTRLTLADPNRQLGPRKVRVEPLAWQDEAGRSFSGWLMHAATTRKPSPRPLFITYYLCEGFLRGGVGDEWPLAPLAESGIVALCINRVSLGAAKSGDAVAHYDAALSGVRSVIALLAKRGLIDPRRVGMGGLSFGSEVTAWIAREPGLLSAISLSSTLMEPSYYWMNGVAGRDNHAVLKQIWQLGSPAETPQRWQELSPALNPERYDLPILFQMPEQEFRLNMQLFSELSEAGAPVEMYAFPNEPHIKTQPRHKLAVYQRNLDWFRFWLLGAVDPDPAKAEQYRRWRAFAGKSGTHDARAKSAPQQPSQD